MCGRGHLFRQWVRMVGACPTCGLRFPREAGQWLGSWFLNVCVVQAVLVAVLSIEVAVTWPERPSWGLLSIAFVAAVVVPVAFFPFSRTIWVAIDLCMRPLDFDDGVAPGVELEQLEKAAVRPGGTDVRPRPARGGKAGPGV